MTAKCMRCACGIFKRTFGEWPNPLLLTRFRSTWNDPDKFTRGSGEYYARKCLEAALTAYRSKNYGIGAVAVVYEAETAREWSAGNCMVSGSGVIDHAETRALLRIAKGEVPDATYGPHAAAARLFRISEARGVQN
jgi:hypothetical protein